MRFEWDPAKAARNVRAHGITFGDATDLFAPGAVVLEAYDVEHSATEDRFQRIGMSRRGVLMVVYTERGDGGIVRIISARRADRVEQARYNLFLKGNKP
jgi:uncharacterized DUF497 family protein